MEAVKPCCLRLCSNCDLHVLCECVCICALNAGSGLSRLKMVARLMVDRRVVLATSLYGLVGLLQVMMNEVCVRMPTRVRTYAIHMDCACAVISGLLAPIAHCTLQSLMRLKQWSLTCHMSSEFTRDSAYPIL